MGNLITDSLYQKLRQKSNGLNSVAMIEAKDIWGSINFQNKSDYNITLPDILYSFAAERYAWTEKISGSQLKHIFENSIADYHQETSSHQFLQISGN